MSNPPFGELTASAQQSAADASSAYDQQSHQRNERGQFAPGNASGMATRFQPAGMLPNQSDLHASLSAKRSAIAADLGDDLSTICSDDVDRSVALDCLWRTLLADIEARGMLTSKGRQRASLTALLLLTDRIDRVVARLGIARKARPADIATQLARLHHEGDDAPR